jgi:outer membrane protein
MKKFAFPIFLFIVFSAGKDVKIGFVDSERIFDEYQATAAAQVEFDEYVSTLRDSAAVLKLKIEQLQSELEAQKLVLSEEARLRKLDEIESSTKEYNGFLQDVFGHDGKVEQKNEILMTPLLKKINDGVANVAQQEGFTIVLDLSEGVYYASTELDLTDLVIDELNLEYGPQTLPSGEAKKVIAIFPFREENTEATNADLSQYVQDELYKVINAFSQQFDIVSKMDIRSEIIRRGYGRNLDDTQAYSIAHTLLCDYIVIGSVSKFATRIDYTMSLKEVATSTDMDKMSGSVTEQIKLTESLNNNLKALIQKIQQ